jgi:hypothetical protein
MVAHPRQLALVKKRERLLVRIFEAHPWLALDPGAVVATATLASAASRPSKDCRLQRARFPTRTPRLGPPQACESSQVGCAWRARALTMPSSLSP